MSKWVPGVALIGLICVMLMPAPGMLGITIGVGCVLAIAASVVMVLFERFVTKVVDPMIEAVGRRRMSKRRRRAVHAGSGIARKV